MRCSVSWSEDKVAILDDSSLSTQPEWIAFFLSYRMCVLGRHLRLNPQTRSVHFSHIQAFECCFGTVDSLQEPLQRTPESWNMALGGLVLGSLILYLRGTRIMMFQLSGFYCKLSRNLGGNRGTPKNRNRIDNPKPLTLKNAPRTISRTVQALKTLGKPTTNLYMKPSHGP